MRAGVGVVIFCAECWCCSSQEQECAVRRLVVGHLKSCLLCQAWLWVTTHCGFYFTLCSGFMLNCLGKALHLHGDPIAAAIPFLVRLMSAAKCQTGIGKNWIWHQASSLRPPVTSSALEMQFPSLWFLMLQENRSHKSHLLNHRVAEVLPAFHLIINSREANVKEQIYEKRPSVFC